MSSYCPDENVLLWELDSRLNFTEEAFEAPPQSANHVSYILYALPQERSQLHDGTNTTQPQEFFGHPSNPSQFLPPDAAQPADLATDVQVIEAPGVASGNSPNEEIPCCRPCGLTFGRPQELKRHLEQKHVPRRECPFKPCTFKWIRPAKIKDHIAGVHGSKLCPVVLQQIRSLRGKRVLEFVDAYEFGCSIETSEPCVLPPLPAPFRESGPYLSDYCRCCLERKDDFSCEGVVKQMIEEVRGDPKIYDG